MLHRRGLHPRVRPDGAKGICNPVAVVWHAYVRWARLQGIDAQAAFEEWTFGHPVWPDGWLADVPALAQRRGSAPATVAAVRGGRSGDRDWPATSSHGAHALTRTLPLGLATTITDVQELAGDVAALSHAGPAVAAASAGAGLVHAITTGSDLITVARQTVAAHPALADAVDAAGRRPGEVETLRALAPDRSAMAVLSGAVYAAMSFDPPDRIIDVLTLAAAAPDGASVAATAGGIYGVLAGATSGADVFPVPWLSRLELVWVVDSLARDMVREMNEGPSGGDYRPTTDPYWWRRYPGW